jgi:hypothetical protein
VVVEFAELAPRIVEHVVDDLDGPDARPIDVGIAVAVVREQVAHQADAAALAGAVHGADQGALGVLALGVVGEIEPPGEQAVLDRDVERGAAKRADVKQLVRGPLQRKVIEDDVAAVEDADGVDVAGTLPRWPRAHSQMPDHHVMRRAHHQGPVRRPAQAQLHAVARRRLPGQVDVGADLDGAVDLDRAGGLEHAHAWPAVLGARPERSGAAVVQIGDLDHGAAAPARSVAAEALGAGKGRHVSARGGAHAVTGRLTREAGECGG